MKNMGVVYCSTGNEEYHRLTLNSINSIIDDLPITIFTDDVGYDFFNKHLDVDMIIVNTIPKRSRLECFNQSPYERTLYLDSDTIVHSKLIGDFLILDKFDIACCQDSMRYGNVKFELYEKNKHLFSNIPISFPEYNPGVLFYKKNELTINLFNTWIDVYDRIIYPDWLHDKIDQPAFRYALYNSDVNLSTLPVEYNVTPGLNKLYENSPSQWNFNIRVEHMCMGYIIKTR